MRAIWDSSSRGHSGCCRETRHRRAARGSPASWTRHTFALPGVLMRSSALLWLSGFSVFHPNQRVDHHDSRPTPFDLLTSLFRPLGGQGGVEWGSRPAPSGPRQSQPPARGSPTAPLAGSTPSPFPNRTLVLG